MPEAALNTDCAGHLHRRNIKSLIPAHRATSLDCCCFCSFVTAHFCELIPQGRQQSAGVCYRLPWITTVSQAGVTQLLWHPSPPHSSSSATSPLSCYTSVKIKPKLLHCRSITFEKPWGCQSFLKQCSLQLLALSSKILLLVISAKPPTLVWLKLIHEPVCIKNPYKILLWCFYKKHSRNSKLKNCSLAKSDHCCYFKATTAPHMNTVPVFTAPQGSNLVYKHLVNGEFPASSVFSNPLFVLLFVLWKDFKSPSFKYWETWKTTACMLDIHHTLEDLTSCREFKCMQPFLNVTAKWSEPR